MTERLRKDSWNQSLTKMVFLASSERYSPIVISSKYALTDWARMIIQAVRLSFNLWSIVCSYFACSLIKTAVKSLHFCCSDTYQKHYSLNNQWMLGSHKKVSVSCKSFWHPKILFQRWEQCLHDCPLYNPFTLADERHQKGGVGNNCSSNVVLIVKQHHAEKSSCKRKAVWFEKLVANVFCLLVSETSQAWLWHNSHK